MTLQEAIQQRDEAKIVAILIKFFYGSRGKKFREAEEELNFWQGKVAWFISRSPDINSFK